MRTLVYGGRSPTLQSRSAARDVTDATDDTDFSIARHATYHDGQHGSPHLLSRPVVRLVPCGDPLVETIGPTCHRYD